MSSAKQEIFGKIRSANKSYSVDRSVDYASIKRTYQRQPLYSAEGRIELFIDRLNDYGSVVHRCGQSEIAHLIGEILGQRAVRSVVVAPGLPRDWLPNRSGFIQDEDLTYQQIDSTEGVLTSCAVAIASTGTIVLAHSQAEGRRAITLIPDYHLCVVFEEQVLETVPEAIDRLRLFGNAPLTTISGPSATSDIEMTRVKGVHGPRTLEIILAKS